MLGDVATVDDGFLRAGAALTTGLANDCAALGMEFYALHHLGDEKLATICGERARMKKEREERIRNTLFELAKSNPEKYAKFFGAVALLDPAAWVGQLAFQANAIRKQGEALRAAPRAVTGPVAKPASVTHQAAPAATGADRAPVVTHTPDTSYNEPEGGQ